MRRIDRLIQSMRKASWETAFLKNIDLTDTIDVENDPYKKSALAYVCISYTTRAISQVPLIVQELKNDAWETVPDVDNWQQRLKRPNRLMSSAGFIEAIVGNLMLDGNVWIVPFPPKAKIPDSLWVVKKTNMEIKKDTNGQPVGWTYNPNDASSIPLGFHEAAHVKFWNPSDPIFGQRPLEAGKLPLSGDYKAATYNDKFLEEGAIPGLILSTEKNLGERQFNRIQEQFDSRHKGFRKAHRTALLEGGLKAEKVGLTQKDMDFLKLREYSRDEILQIFGMKKTIISITEDINYSTDKQQRKEWWQDTNLPIMRLITAAMNYVFFQGRHDVRIAFDIAAIEALEEEMSKKVETAGKLFNMGYPLNLINQRLQLGFPKLLWGDHGFLPLNLIPVSGNPEDVYTPPVSEQLPATEMKLIEGKVPRLEQVWKSFIARTLPIEGEFEKKTKRVFWEMRKKILEKLHEDEKTKDLADFYEWIKEYDFSVEQNLLEKYSKPLYALAVKEGLESIVEEGVEISVGLSDPAAIHFLQTKPLKIKSVINNTILGQIRDVLQDGAEQGLSIQQIEDKLKLILNFASNRASTIARTEIVGSANFGRHIALESSGFSFKEWFTALDEKVRDQHIRMHGKVIPINESWILPDGSILLYPGDWNGPAHQSINCRCVEVSNGG